MADKPVRADKATAVAELTEQFRDSAATLLTEYRGLTVAQLKELRRSLGRQTTALSFLVNRPSEEPGFRLDRQEFADRQIKYTLHPYATEQPAGQRYGDGKDGT